MRASLVFVVLGTAFAGCVASTRPPSPAADVAGIEASSASSPTILERARSGLLYVDGGPDGADAPADDPHAHHHGHHGHAAPVVDAGTPAAHDHGAP